jgi:uncharacterized protein with HEPN domain
LPFRGPSLSLRDIADAIAAIKQFIQGLDSGTFCADPKTVAAVEPKLQVISEAAARLGNEAEILPRPSVARYSWYWQLAATSVRPR